VTSALQELSNLELASLLFLSNNYGAYLKGIVICNCYIWRTELKERENLLLGFSGPVIC
jgi:hypothetical protein